MTRGSGLAGGLEGVVMYCAGVVPGVQYTLDHFINVPQINFLCALYPNMFLMYIKTLFIKN